MAHSLTFTEPETCTPPPYFFHSTYHHLTFYVLYGLFVFLLLLEYNLHENSDCHLSSYSILNVQKCASHRAKVQRMACGTLVFPAIGRSHPTSAWTFFLYLQEIRPPPPPQTPLAPELTS